MPFLRRCTMAASISPFASVRAFLQSIIGAPVFSRSSFTCAADMFAMDVLIGNSTFWAKKLVVLHKTTRALDELHGPFDSVAAGELFCFGGFGFYFFFQRADRRLAHAFHHFVHAEVHIFAFAFSRTFTASVRGGFSSRCGSARHLGGLLVSGGGNAFHHGIRDLRREQPDSTQRVIIAGNHVIHFRGIAVSI